MGLSGKVIRKEPQRRVNLDLPVWMIDALDRESLRVGVPRQALMKLWLSERLDMVRDGSFRS